jgi:hypothetical protein
MGEIRVTSVQAVREESDAGLFLFSLAVYQYGLLTSVFADLRLGPANLQVTLVTLLLVACAVARRDDVVRALGWQSLLVLAAGLAFIPFKMLIGMLGTDGLQTMRMFFMLPLIWAVYAAYATDQVTRSRIATIIIWNCVFAAVFGLVHFFFFPTVFLSPAQTDAYKAGNIYLIPGHSQEAAFFGNASGYGAILVTGLFAIYLTRRRTFAYVTAFFLITAATYLSISRSASLFATVLLALYLADGVSWRRPQALIPIAAVVGLVAYLVARIPFIRLAATVAAGRVAGLGPGSTGPRSAFSDPTQIGRLQRYEVGLRIVFRDLSHVFFGSPDKEEPIIGDINFSDNSFIFLALAFGVPLTLLWIATVLRRTIGMRVRADLRQLPILLFVYVTLITTPSLSWDMWLVYAVGLLFLGEDTVAREPQPAVLPAPGYAI